MVLRSWIAVVSLGSLVVATGCKQSLFDAHGDSDARPGDVGGADGADAPGIPGACPDLCLADAGADFDGSAGGVGMHWRYLDDSRLRMWSAMSLIGGRFVGGDSRNRIEPCVGSHSAACAALPGALQFSTAGMTAAADPAISYTVLANQRLRLDVIVRVPGGAPSQVVRLYRNSREDVLFTGVALADVTLAHQLEIDALDGDRLYLAIAPADVGALNVAVQFYISEPGTMFPVTCQNATRFSGAQTTPNECSDIGSFTFEDDVAGPVPPVLGPGPFPELGTAASIVVGKYYAGSARLDKTRDTTLQLWVREDMINGQPAYLFSDLDSGGPGGITISLVDDTAPKISIYAPAALSTVTMVDYPNDHLWHFLRLAQLGNVASVCLDGVKKGQLSAAVGSLDSPLPPFLGTVDTATGGNFTGAIDDVRVFSEALPCE